MIEFLHPWVFAALPIPWLAWRLLPPLAAHSALPVPLPVRQLIVGLSTHGQRQSRNAPEDVWLKVLGWLLLVLALTGPYSRHSALLAPTGRDLMIAIDLSASMEEQDMVLDGRGVSRHSVVSDRLGKFIKSRTGDRIGLIAYGHEAYLVSPLSYDLEAVAAVLHELRIGLSGHRTDLGRAIGLAIKSFDKQQTGTRVLVLLSDGEDNSGELTGPDAADLAAARGIRIHTIGFSSKIEADGAAILRTIAQSTGGQLFWAKSTSDLAATSNAITRLEPTVRPEDEQHLKRDWGPYLIGAALLIMAALVWRELRRA
ncbi:MAG: VWA domain-containing protein [Gammaproteobacteria bacterium]|nr:VWA domain-containing protein [Gammaproteobacteria bacterium]